MNYQTNDRCACINCPTNGCQCGCQSTMSAAPMDSADQQCRCGSACRCDGGDQGCSCK